VREHPGIAERRHPARRPLHADFAPRAESGMVYVDDTTIADEPAHRGQVDHLSDG
jgi:hypothetical protein